MNRILLSTVLVTFAVGLLLVIWAFNVESHRVIRFDPDLAGELLGDSGIAELPLGKSFSIYLYNDKDADEKLEGKEHHFFWTVRKEAKSQSTKYKLLRVPNLNAFKSISDTGLYTVQAFYKWKPVAANQFRIVAGEPTEIEWDLPYLDDLEVGATVRIEDNTRDVVQRKWVVNGDTTDFNLHFEYVFRDHGLQNVQLIAQLKSGTVVSKSTDFLVRKKPIIRKSTPKPTPKPKPVNEPVAITPKKKESKPAPKPEPVAEKKAEPAFDGFLQAFDEGFKLKKKSDYGPTPSLPGIKIESFNDLKTGCDLDYYSEEFAIYFTDVSEIFYLSSLELALDPSAQGTSVRFVLECTDRDKKGRTRYIEDVEIAFNPNKPFTVNFTDLSRVALLQQNSYRLTIIPGDRVALGYVDTACSKIAPSQIVKISYAGQKCPVFNAVLEK